MSVLRYACREAAASLWRRRSASVLSVVAIGLAVLVLGVVLVITSNLERLVADWSSGAELSVFLRDDVSGGDRVAVERLIDDSAIAAGRRFVSKDEALSRFRGDFADLAALAGDADANPFPASVEVRIRADARTGERVDALAAALSRSPGVADVRFDRQWLARVSGVLTAVRRVGVALALVMLAAAALTVVAVVRLALHARRDELEVMLLVGSPYAYIRGPFIVEGMVQGGAGAALALVLLWVLCVVATAWWGSDLAAVAGIGDIRFLAAGVWSLLMVGGVAVGGLGGLAATRAVK